MFNLSKSPSKHDVSGARGKVVPTDSGRMMMDHPRLYCSPRLSVLSR